ncbi:MAG TPA: fasciclin domain-containing protein [Burkholderiales bacterium]|nr:fasciclin domain-containing protein [Burkholderiales bacterium]
MATAGHHKSKTIVDIAASNGSFNTLVVALKEADLVDTLSGDGPFTVFAPTDEAFAKIPKADLDALLADKAKLTRVLTYHVVSGKVMAADVKPGMVKTIEGSDLEVTTSNGVMVNNAKVTMTDIVGSNGVIHVIDTVVIPN